MALPLPAMACDTALLLTIDVSNSIDTAEYRLQTDGLADALLDGEVAEARLQSLAQSLGEGVEVKVSIRKIATRTG